VADAGFGMAGSLVHHEAAMHALHCGNIARLTLAVGAAFGKGIPDARFSMLKA
jgi:hypothetical protein